MHILQLCVCSFVRCWNHHRACRNFVQLPDLLYRGIKFLRAPLKFNNYRVPTTLHCHSGLFRIDNPFALTIISSFRHRRRHSSADSRPEHPAIPSRAQISKSQRNPGLNVQGMHDGRYGGVRRSCTCWQCFVVGDALDDDGGVIASGEGDRTLVARYVVFLFRESKPHPPVEP